eukprot:scaffold245349_cov19-Tisochrysis_lutea.AAC.1
MMRRTFGQAEVRVMRLHPRPRGPLLGPGQRTQSECLRGVPECARMHKLGGGTWGCWRVWWERALLQVTPVTFVSLVLEAT